MSDQQTTDDVQKPANIRLRKDSSGWVLEWDIFTPGAPMQHIRRLTNEEGDAIQARGYVVPGDMA